MWLDSINQWAKVPKGNSATAKINGTANVVFEPLTQVGMKPPSQPADPRSLEGVPQIMR